MLERHELVEKQFSFGNRKKETLNSLPNILGTQSCTVLDLHLSSTVMMMTKKCFILTSLKSSLQKTPLQPVFVMSTTLIRSYELPNVVNSKYLGRYVPTSTDGKAVRSVGLKGFQMFQENLTLFQINI